MITVRQASIYLQPQQSGIITYGYIIIIEGYAFWKFQWIIACTEKNTEFYQHLQYVGSA